jgi:beta-glucosidase/6-phospho-beta-glucosidase/beta-galactosidase
MQEVMQETNIKIKSYFAWTLIDNFEWQEGFTAPFGSTIYRTDTKSRYLKDSFFYLKEYFGKTIS